MVYKGWSYFGHWVWGLQSMNEQEMWYYEILYENYDLDELFGTTY
jgi:hypothetical protein